MKLIQTRWQTSSPLWNPDPPVHYLITNQRLRPLLLCRSVLEQNAAPLPAVGGAVLTSRQICAWRILPFFRLGKRVAALWSLLISFCVISYEPRLKCSRNKFRKKKKGGFEVRFLRSKNHQLRIWPCKTNRRQGLHLPACLLNFWVIQTAASWKHFLIEFKINSCSALEAWHEEFTPTVLNYPHSHWTPFPRIPFYSGYLLNDRMSVFKKEDKMAPRCFFNKGNYTSQHSLGRSLLTPSSRRLWALLHHPQSFISTHMLV